MRLDRLETHVNSDSDIDASKAEDWIAAFPHSEHVLNTLKETDDDEPDTDPELTPLPTDEECAIANRQKLCDKLAQQPDPKKVKLQDPETTSLAAEHECVLLPKFYRPNKK